MLSLKNRLAVVKGQVLFHQRQADQLLDAYEAGGPSASDELLQKSSHHRMVATALEWLLSEFAVKGSATSEPAQANDTAGKSPGHDEEAPERDRVIIAILAILEDGKGRNAEWVGRALKSRYGIEMPAAQVSKKIYWLATSKGLLEPDTMAGRGYYRIVPSKQPA